MTTARDHMPRVESVATALPFGAVAHALDTALATLDSEGRVLWNNPSFARILSEQGLCDPGSGAPAVTSALSAIAEGQLLDDIRATAASGQPRGGICVHTDAKGGVSYWRWFGGPIVHDGMTRPELLLRLEDATVEDDARADVSAIIDRARAVSESARDIILLMNPDGAIVHANRSAEIAYGYTTSELLGMNIRQLRAETTHAEMSDQMATASERGILFETEHQRADGAVFPVEVSSRGVRIHDKDALLSIIRDISRRREREAEQDWLIDELARVNQRLDGVLRVVSSALNTLEPRELLAEVLETLRRVMDADATLLFRADEDVFRVLAFNGFDDLLHAHYSIPRGTGFAECVVEANHALFAPDVPNSSFASEAHRASGAQAALGVPLRHDGRVFGVLECVWCEPRDVSEAEMSLLEVAGERVMTAIANAERFQRTRRREHLGHALNEVNTLVNSGFDLVAPMHDALRVAAEALECDLALHGSYDGPVLRVHAAWGTEPGSMPAPPGQPATGASLPQLMPVTLSPGTPEGEWLADNLDLSEAVVVPLRAQTGFAGSLLFGRREARGFEDIELEFVSDVAGSVSAAVGNVAQFQAEHRIAEALQEALLAVPVNVPGVEFGHLYRSATVATRVGGDFFDVFPLGAGQVGVLIGDISGKGLEAAVLTSLIKDTVRAYAHEGLAPAEVLSKANAVLHAAARLPEFASALFLLLDTTKRTLTYCCAGHPPAIVLSPDSIRSLECRSPLIGAFLDMAYIDDAVTLGPDDVVVLYTDGVTEARAGAEFFGEERLAEMLVKLRGTPVRDLPAEMLARVLDFAGGSLSDDIAILALRFA